MPVDAPQLLAIPVPQATTDSSLGTSQCGEGILPDLTSETLLSRSLSQPAPSSCSQVPELGAPCSPRCLRHWTKFRVTHGGDCVLDSWALGGCDVPTGSLCWLGRAPTPAVRPPKGPCEGPEGASFEQHVANMWMIPRGERAPQQCSLQGKGVSDQAHMASRASKAAC